jgi:hypothetical protein
MREAATTGVAEGLAHCAKPRLLVTAIEPRS